MRVTATIDVLLLEILENAKTEAPLLILMSSLNQKNGDWSTSLFFFGKDVGLFK